MDKKSNFRNNSLFGFVLKNILKAAAILLVLIAAALLLLHFYTKHGRSEIVPKLKDLPVEDAISTINRHNLKFEIVDSVHVKEKKPGIIIEQNPAANTVVKPFRTIYLIINAKTARQIALPDLRDLSLRQAEAIAKSLGIHVSGVEYAASEYKDLILDVKYKGQSLAVGTKIPEGSSIELIAGNGFEQLAAGIVPYLTGQNLTEASAMLSSTSYQIGGIVYDTPPAGDEAEYLIVGQSPDGGTSASAGSVIDVWLSKNPAQTKENFPRRNSSTQEPKQDKEKEKDIEEFF